MTIGAGIAIAGIWAATAAVCFAGRKQFYPVGYLFALAIAAIVTAPIIPTN